MNTHTDTRRPEQIEDEIERTRADVGATIDAIQEKLTPGQMMDQALQYVRSSGAGDFGSNLGRAVRDNPLPVALIGIGVAWLAMGGRLRGDHSPWDDTPRLRTRRVAAADEADADGVADDDWLAAPRDEMEGEAKDGEAGPGLGERLSGAAASTGASVRDTGSSATDRVREALSGTTGRVTEGVSGAARRARGFAHDAGERIGAWGERAREGAGSLQHRTRGGLDRTRERTMRMIDEQPLVLGAIGVAIGAAIGAALPATRREDAMLGDARDGILEGAGEAAREGLQGAASSARRVVRTAREEVERAVSAGPGRDDPDPMPSGTGTAASTPPGPANPPAH